MPSLDDKYKCYIKRHEAITKIAKTKLKPISKSVIDENPSWSQS